jgi:hypothetical protein
LPKTDKDLIQRWPGKKIPVVVHVKALPWKKGIEGYNETVFVAYRMDCLRDASLASASEVSTFLLVRASGIIEYI